MSAKLCKYTYFYIHDHLGSTSMVLDADGNISQSVTYVPYGEIFVEERNGAWNSPYLFNSKELDEETGLYYYGARYLNPTSAVWMSVDPLWEKNIDASPYSYCHGNPVNKIDVMGLDDYGVDDNGYIFFIKKTESEKDRLIAGVKRRHIEKEYGSRKSPYDISGKLKSDIKNIEVSKGKLRETTEDDKNAGGQLFRFNNIGEAKSMFEFMAKNTKVEWSFFDLKNSKNNTTSFMLGTSHNWKSEKFASTFLARKICSDKLTYKSTFHIHCHPNISSVPFDQGISPSDDDIDTAKIFTNAIGGKNMEFKIFLDDGNRSEYRKFEVR